MKRASHRHEISDKPSFEIVNALSTGTTAILSCFDDIMDLRNDCSPQFAGLVGVRLRLLPIDYFEV
jgi:hypothetical protein